MFTPYLGLGYNSTKTTFNVEGHYNVAGLAIDVSDLTKIDFESNNTLRANIGFRFNIAVMALQANYTFAKYPTATVGIGISVR
jgi:outer membrane protein W